MSEEPYPYNQPPWRRSYQATSPNGQWCAKIEKALEISMSGPPKEFCQLILCLIFRSAVPSLSGRMTPAISPFPNGNIFFANVNASW